MSVSAMLCGMNCFSDIEDFCDLQIDWLRKWIKMPNGVPRAQTFSNIFAIMALRSLYTLVATAVNTLEYIKPVGALW